MTPNPLVGVTTTLDYTETYSYNAIGNLTSKAGVTYSYTGILHKHAVAGLSNGSSVLRQTYDWVFLYGW